MKAASELQKIRVAVNDMFISTKDETSPSIHGLARMIHENLFLLVSWLGIVIKRMGEAPLTLEGKHPGIYDVTSEESMRILIKDLEQIEHDAGTIKTTGIQPLIDDDRLNVASANCYTYAKNAKFYALEIVRIKTNRAELVARLNSLTEKKKKSKEDKETIESLYEMINQIDSE